MRRACQTCAKPCGRSLQTRRRYEWANIRIIGQRKRESVRDAEWSRAPHAISIIIQRRVRMCMYRGASSPRPHTSTRQKPCPGRAWAAGIALPSIGAFAGHVSLAVGTNANTVDDCSDGSYTVHARRRAPNPSPPCLPQCYLLVGIPFWAIVTPSEPADQELCSVLKKISCGFAAGSTPKGWHSVSAMTGTWRHGKITAALATNAVFLLEACGRRSRALHCLHGRGG